MYGSISIFMSSRRVTWSRLLSNYSAMELKTLTWTWKIAQLSVCLLYLHAFLYPIGETQWIIKWELAEPSTPLKKFKSISIYFNHCHRKDWIYRGVEGKTASGRTWSGCRVGRLERKGCRRCQDYLSILEKLHDVWEKFHHYGMWTFS